MTKEVDCLVVPPAKKAFFQLWLPKEGAVRGMSWNAERGEISHFPECNCPRDIGTLRNLPQRGHSRPPDGRRPLVSPARPLAHFLQPSAPHLLPARHTAWFAQFPGSRREAAVLCARRRLLPRSDPGGPWPTTPSAGSRATRRRQCRRCSPEATPG